MRSLRDIKCDTPECGCVKQVQSLGYPTWRRFVLTNKEKKIMWFDNPKCASMTIKANINIEFTHALPRYHTTYFKFIFVRNPFDRIVSNWKMFTNTSWAIKKIQSYPPDVIRNIRTFSFKEFVELTEIVNNHHWDEQYYFMRSNPDFIGRFENFQNDFDTLCDKIEIPRKQLPRKNSTNHKHYTEYYDEETKQIVAEKYAKDIEYFGYEFGK